jgi:O-antigen ligase
MFNNCARECLFAGEIRLTMRLSSAAPVWPPNVGKLELYAYLMLGAVSFIVFFEPAPYDLIAACLLLLFAWQVWCSRLVLPFDRLTTAALLLFSIFVLLHLPATLLQSQSTLRSVFYSAVTIFLALSGAQLAYLYAAGDRRATYFLLGYCFAVLASALLLFIAYIPWVDREFGDVLFFQRTWRAKAFFKDPNVLGPFMVPAFLILVEASCRMIRYRSALLGAAAVCAGASVITASRGAWGNLIVTAIVYVLLSDRERKRALLIGLVGAGLVITLFFGWLELLKTYSSSAAGVTLSTRMDMQGYDRERFRGAKKAISLGLQFPIGVGPGMVVRYNGLEPHNSVLKVFAEIGPAAAVVFVGLGVASLIGGLTAAIRARGQGAVPVALLLGATFTMLFVDVLHWRHFWVIASFALFAPLAVSLRSSRLPDAVMQR